MHDCDVYVKIRWPRCQSWGTRKVNDGMKNKLRVRERNPTSISKQKDMRGNGGEDHPVEIQKAKQTENKNTILRIPPIFPGPARSTYPILPNAKTQVVISQTILVSFFTYLFPSFFFLLLFFLFPLSSSPVWVVDGWEFECSFSLLLSGPELLLLSPCHQDQSEACSSRPG